WIDNSLGQPIFTSNLSDVMPQLPTLGTGTHVFEIPIPAHFLAPDRYSATIATHRPHVEVLDLQEHALHFEVEEVGSRMARYHGSRYGNVIVGFPWIRVRAENGEQLHATAEVT